MIEAGSSASRTRAYSLVGTAVLHVAALSIVLAHVKAPTLPERRPALPVLVTLGPPDPPPDPPVGTAASEPPLQPPSQPPAPSRPAPIPPPASTSPRAEAGAVVAAPRASAPPGSTATRRLAARRPVSEPVSTPASRAPVAAASPPVLAASTTAATPAAAGPETSSAAPAGPAASAPAAAAQPSAPASATAAVAPAAMPASVATPAAALRTGPRVGAGLSEDAIRKVYPRSAIRMGIEGLVVLDVQVGVDGRAREVRVRKSSGYDVLDEAAAAMVREASFAAATVDGAPVTDWLAGLRIRFALER